ncbi:hypothetical protein BH10BAC5_BH10BAC5_10290 [soil metagenome]
MNISKLLLQFVAKKILLLFLTFLFFFLIYQTSFSQVLGDYKTVASGNWTDGIWQKYNGSTWVNAVPPTSTDNAISLSFGNTVTLNVNIQLDQLFIYGILTINSGDSLYIANGAGSDLTMIGTVNGPGNIYIAPGSLLDFQNGTIAGSGILNNTGGINVATNSVTIDRIINNFGTINWSSSSITGSGTINNNNNFNILTSFGGSFNLTLNNYGTITKNSVNQNLLNNSFLNSGTVNIQSGNLTFSQSSGTPTVSGIFTLSSGGTVQFGQGSFAAYIVSANISGAGNVSASSTTVTYSSSCVYNITGTTNCNSGTMIFSAGMTLTNIGSINSTGGNITLPSGLNLGGYGSVLNLGSGGTLTINCGKYFTFQKIILLGGYITGSDSIIVSDSITLSTGSFQGTGLLTLNAGGYCTIFNNSPTIDRTFINNGTINWSLNSIVGTGTLINNSIINMTNNANSCYMSLINSGTLTKTSNTTTQFLNSVTNNPAAIININAGTFMTSAGSNGTYSIGGNINIASGTLFQLGNSNTLTYNISGNITGAGIFASSTTNVNLLSGSTFNISGGTTAYSGNLTFNSGMTLSNIGNLSTSGGVINLQPGLTVSSIGSSLSLTGGGTINFNSGQKFQFNSITCNSTIAGSDTIVLSGNMTFSGGVLTGTGPLNILTGSIVDINNNGVQISKTVNSAGTINWIQSSISGGGTINNNYIFNISTTAAYGCGAIINNNGTINKGTNTSPTMSGGINNAGTVNITSGTLNISPNSGIFTHNGGFYISSSAALNINQASGIENFNGTLSGSGNVIFNASLINMNSTSVYNISGNTTIPGGTVTLNSSTTVTNLGNLTVSGGILNLPAGLIINAMGSNLTLSSGQINFNTGRPYTFSQVDLGGTMGGADTIYVSTTLNWSGNAIASTSVVNIKPGAAANINVNGVQVNGVLINNGTLNWVQNGISGTGIIVNNSLMNMNTTAAHGISCSLINNGTINKTTNFSNNISGTLTNNSILNINTGTLSIMNGSSTGIINIASGAALSENNGTFISYSTLSIPLNATLSGNSTFIQNGLNFGVDGIVTVANMQFDSITTISGSGSINTTSTFLNGCNVVLGSNFQFKNITLNSGGNFNLNGYKALVNGIGAVISNNGNLNMANSTIEYNGSSAQVVSNLNITYKNLIINNPAGTSISSGILNVNDTLKVISGFLNISAFSVSLGTTGFLIENQGTVVKGTTGSISATRTLNAPVNINVGGLGATITSASNLGSTIVTRGFTNYSINGNNTVLRYYNISPANNAGLNANLTYHFDSFELNGLNKNLLNLYRSTNSGSNWTLIGGMRDTSANNITYSGINAFSYWTAGVNPLSATLNIKVVVEALYNSTFNTLNKKDTITVYLRNSSSPYNILDSSKVLIDTISFLGNANFNNTSSGTYYLSFKYRNGLETWSKAGGLSYTSGSGMSYDLTTSQAQSYGSSTVLKNGLYCIISGDLNQDGFINGNDFTIFSQQFGQTGYINADLNGDGNVNGNDFTSFSSSFGKQNSHP